MYQCAGCGAQQSLVLPTILIFQSIIPPLPSESPDRHKANITSDAESTMTKPCPPQLAAPFHTLLGEFRNQT